MPPFGNVFSCLKHSNNYKQGFVIVSKPNFSQILQLPLPITLKQYTCDKKYNLDYCLPLFEVFPKLGLSFVVGDEMKCFIKEGPKIVSVSKL